VNQPRSSGRSVVLLRIVDTGNTIEELFHIFSKQNVKKLKVATLFLNLKPKKIIDYVEPNSK
jgi:hypoxanthine-guanine phosphoribosyltransferase